MDRMDKINELMRREISTMIHQEFNDPRVKLVTITGVKVSRDLRYAKVYFSILGESSQADKVADVLNNAKGLVRRLIGQKVQLRFTPEIQFIHDRNIAYGVYMDQKLNELGLSSEQQAKEEERDAEDSPER